MTYITKYTSPIGDLLLTSNGEELTGVWFDRPLLLEAIQISEYERKEVPVLLETKRWLDIYFQGENPDFMPPLSWKSTPFREMVWEELRTIPYGETITYGEIAKRIAKRMSIEKMSAQAVGGAVGHNPISILVPCHRVIGTNGKLTGYAGGMDKKIKLLELEGHIIRER